MQAIILAGGFGTRLKTLVKEGPQLLYLKKILLIIYKNLIRQKINELAFFVVLC